jgi:hypothetical protein
MRPELVISVFVFGVVLAMRFLMESAQPKRKPNNKHRLRLAKHLALGLIGLLAVYYNLQSVDRGLDGKTDHTPSWVERAVLKVAE